MEKSADGRVSFLNVGTKILLKDVMDQYLRTLGDYQTHYASTMSAALRMYSENMIHVVITENDLGDGSAYRLIQDLGGTRGDDDLYVILALEDHSDSLMALASELEAHAVLVKPFAAVDLKTQIDKYKIWKAMPKEPWKALIESAKHAVRDKRYREAEDQYKQAIQVAPTNPSAIFQVALYYLAKPEPVIAEKLLLKCIELKPDYVRALSTLGSFYLGRHDLDKAEKFLGKAQELSPLNPDRLVEMVRLYTERAIDACKSSLRLDPSGMMARFNLGKLHAFQKDYPGAIRELEKVIPMLKDELKTEAQTFTALARKLGGLAK